MTRAWAPLTPERHLIGASLLRIGIGSLLLYRLASQWDERHSLWGPGGAYPLWLFQRDLLLSRAPSFFATESIGAFDAVYLVGMLVALLYAVGWQTRLTGIWVYVLAWSLLKRNPFLVTGGDTLFLVQLPFVLLMNTSAHLSMDAHRRRATPDEQPPPRSFAALFHNIGMFGIKAQLCILYASSGLYKLLGDTWRDGTAAYYALRAHEFALPGVSPFIYDSPVLVASLTYAVLAFELGFPLLIWSGRTRPVAVLAAVLFHGGITVVMGLVLFAAHVLVFVLILVDDERYRSGHRLLSRARSAIRRPVLRGADES